jgi:hypothetical protein
VAPTWRPHAVRPGTHEVKAPTFDPARHDANFVVTTMQDGSGFYIPQAWIISAFGRPAHIYHYSVGVMTWNKNLLLRSANRAAGTGDHRARPDARSWQPPSKLKCGSKPALWWARRSRLRRARCCSATCGSPGPRP